MLTEREYRIACIRERFSKLRGRRIVIYGTGINAKLIIDHTKGVIDLLGLMDASQTGRVLYDHRVLSENEVIDLHADTIVIAAQIDSAIAVYDRIRGFCSENKLDVFDLYGNNIVELKRSIITLEADSSPTGFMEAKAATEAADVVSIDLNALFSCDIKESDLFRMVWESRFRNGTASFIELRKRTEVQQKRTQGSMDSIYGVLRSYLCFPEDVRGFLAETELQLRKKNMIICRKVERLAEDVLAKGKRLIFINESVFPTSFWMDVLERVGIKKDRYTLLNRAETGHNKFNGLYRDISDLEPDRKYVHIGKDYNADGIAASVYGFQSIVVRDPACGQLLENEISDRTHCVTELLREYCTDSMEYAVEDCVFPGYIKLNIRNDFYVFVRGDAGIRPGWLEQLVGTMECHNTASLICSRVSLEDGTVLYAGEMVSEDPDAQRSQLVSGFLPQYDYVRFVGQVSVLSFLVYRKEWDAIEDVSAGMHGVLQNYLEACGDRKALYQPLSEVSFRQDRWEFDKPFVLADIKKRPKILVTDNLLTKFDRDAGSRCTWFYLQQFHKLGFDVTLMAQNFDEVQPYVMRIQQAGIRVIYGKYFRSNLKSWLEEEKDSFRYVYMQRPESTTFFLEEIRKNCGSAILFYFAHDLHFLRLYREYEITGNQDILNASEHSKEQECALIEAADVVHVVGSYEQEYLQQMYPGKKIRNIPLYIYGSEETANAFAYNAKKRKDLLYVGSFGHPPNLDAVLWFAEQIFPLIVKRYPDIVWHVVGANPPVEVQKYEGKNLLLHGFLSDDELSTLYQTCRIVVVPLRYGAGVKGKIVEASFYRMPIVTTSIGAEGIPQEENNMIICDEAEDFANAVCNLYLDEQRLQYMSEGGKRLVENHYSESAVNRVLSMDMTEVQA